jgi:hypothetical protein
MILATNHVNFRRSGLDSKSKLYTEFNYFVSRLFLDVNTYHANQIMLKRCNLLPYPPRTTESIRTFKDLNISHNPGNPSVYWIQLTYYKGIGVHIIWFNSYLHDDKSELCPYILHAFSVRKFVIGIYVISRY